MSVLIPRELLKTPLPTNATREEIIWLSGPRLLGILWNWGLLGLITAQVYVYYINFAKDSKYLKSLVYGVYVLDWAQTTSATYDAFQWWVYGFGSIPALYDLWTGFLNVPILSSIIAALVQTFFAWRIWLFSNTPYLPLTIFTLALTQLGGGIAVARLIFLDPNEVSRVPGLLEAVGVRLGASGLVDIVIAITMTSYLVRSRAKAGARSNDALTRLIRLTVETGTLTAVFAIVDLVFFTTQHNGLHQISGVVLCKLYSNTLLVSLNNRLFLARLTSSGAAVTLSEIGTSTGNGADVGMRAAQGSGAGKGGRGEPKATDSRAGGRESGTQFAERAVYDISGSLARVYDGHNKNAGGDRGEEIELDMKRDDSGSLFRDAGHAV